MTTEPPPSARPPREADEADDGVPSAERRRRDRKIARGRRLYDNVGTFGDVFKIVLIVVVLIAIAVVFLL